MSHRVKFLVDECLHTSLVRVATDRLYEAYHVTYLGMSGLKDYELMARIREGNFTFVTNNAADFHRLFGKESVHAGLVIIIPNVAPAVQCLLFQAVLDYVGDRDLVNRAIGVRLVGDRARIEEYALPFEE